MKHLNKSSLTRLPNAAIGIAVACIGFFFPNQAADQPQWGVAWTRNLISEERGLADSFDPATSKNIRWIAKLGTETHSTPVIAGGRVYIGTNNGDPRDPKHRGDRGVLMCLAESDGHLEWQLVSPKREEDPYHDWPNSGISSPATVEGDRVYVVNNRGEVLCLDARGMANGNDGRFKDEGAQMTPRGTNAPAQKLEPGTLDADILWLFNLTSGAGIWSHDAAHSSILIDGNFLYLNSGTGVDNTHKRIRTPDAPSLVVLDKRTGQYLARDGEHIAPNIFHCTWSPPSMAEVNGRKLIFFLGGNGILYAFEALPPGFKSDDGKLATLQKIFEFDPDPGAPKQEVHRYNSNRREGPSNFYGMPVFVNNRLYIAGGGDVFWGKTEAWLKCVDATKSGNITKTAEIWSYPLQRHVLSTAAIHNGLAFIADAGKTIHCLDAETGKVCWTHEGKGEFWASPLIADGKVYIGSRHGDFWVFKESRQKEVVSQIDLHAPISATATAANGALYLATMTHLYAILAK